MLTITGLVAAAYCAICALAWAFQERLVWFPGPPPAADPSAFGLAFDDVAFTAADGTALHAWFLPGRSGHAVLISHGNGGSIENVLGLAAVFHKMGHAVLAYDYRGYGRSQGTPSEDGTYDDAIAAFDWLVARGFAPETITAYGHSLGGAVTVALATRRPVARLIVENTFTSLAEIGARAYPFLPVRLLSRIHYDTLARAPTIAAPVLVIHSPDDEVIPFAMGQRLAEALPNATLMVTEGGHNGGAFTGSTARMAEVAAFIRPVP